MVLVLKVFLQQLQTGKCEIRRVSVTSDFVNSYNMLCNKIINLFPCLEGKSYQLFWKDEEGDNIIMSTDQELDQAVVNANNNVLKIYVRFAEDAPNMPESTNSEIVHSNVVCDACNQVVKGHRYKCLQCEDFDLCSLCNALDKHPAHDMVKLVSPSSISRAWFFRGWRSMWQSMFSHEVPREEAGHSHWHHGHHDFKKNKGPSKCPWRANKEVLNMIGQSISSLLSPFGVEATVDVVMSDKEKGANSSNEAESSAAHCARSSDSCKSEAQSSACAGAGNSVEPEAVKKEEAAETATAKSDSEPMQVDQDSCSTSSVSEPSTSKDPGPSAADPSLSWSNPRDFLSAVSKVIAASQATAEGKSKGLYATLQEAAKTIDDWTIVNAPAAEANEASQTEPKLVKEVASPEAVPRETKPEIKPTVEATAGNDVKTGSAETQAHSAQTYDLDPRYASALNYMLSMGFNNDSGWLSKLIQTKEGNINAVLDALYRK